MPNALIVNPLEGQRSFRLDQRLHKEFRKCEVTLLAMNTFMDFLGILKSCADFRVSTEVSRFIMGHDRNTLILY